MFTVLVFHDGRNDYLEQTLGTFSEQVLFPERPYKILIDDMPDGRDVDFLQKIAARFAFDDLILNESNLGSFGSIMKGWSCLPQNTEYIFHLENDFVFASKVDVRELATVLEEPWICNITLLRQAWYEDEREAGGVLKVRPERFREVVVRGIPVCLHQDYFGQTPGLYRRRFARIIADTSCSVSGRILSHEYVYRDILLAEDPSRHFAILGRLTDAPRVFHIGQRCVGHPPDYEPALSEVDAAGLLPECQVIAIEEEILAQSAATLEREIEDFLQPAIAARRRDIEVLQHAVETQERALTVRYGVDTGHSSNRWKRAGPLRLIYDLFFGRRDQRE